MVMPRALSIMHTRQMPMNDQLEPIAIKTNFRSASFEIKIYEKEKVRNKFLNMYPNSLNQLAYFIL